MREPEPDEGTRMLNPNVESGEDRSQNRAVDSGSANPDDQPLVSNATHQSENAVILRPLSISLVCLALIPVTADTMAQGPRPGDLGASKLDPGQPGIAWYTTWESAEAEAKRSGRPIMFVAAATQCQGISGVF